MPRPYRGDTAVRFRPRSELSYGAQTLNSRPGVVDATTCGKRHWPNGGSHRWPEERLGVGGGPIRPCCRVSSSPTTGIFPQQAAQTPCSAVGNTESGHRAGWQAPAGYAHAPDLRVGSRWRPRWRRRGQTTAFSTHPPTGGGIGGDHRRSHLSGAGSRWTRSRQVRLVRYCAMPLSSSCKQRQQYRCGRDQPGRLQRLSHHPGPTARTQSGQLGSKQWLLLYRTLIGRILQGGAVAPSMTRRTALERTIDR